MLTFLVKIASLNNVVISHVISLVALQPSLSTQHDSGRMGGAEAKQTI